MNDSVDPYELAQTDEAETGESENLEVESSEHEEHEEAEGESQENSLDTDGEPTEEEGLFDGMSPQKLHEAYKSLQTELTKRTEGNQGLLDKFEEFGGPDKLLEWATYLNNNDRFSEFIANEQKMNTLGIKESDMDDDTKYAMGMVEKMAESIADQKVQQLLKEHIDPLTTTYKEGLIDSHFQNMDEKYGNDWREVQEVMGQLADTLPQSAHENPTLNDIEDLYWKALRETGKLETHAMKLYEQKLKGKKAQSTDRSKQSTAPGKVTGANSIAEAMAIAKKTVGASFD